MSSIKRSLPEYEVAKLIGHDGPVQMVRFTATGKYCLTGGYDRTVRLWNPARIDPAHPPKQNQVPRAMPIQVYSDGISHAVSAVESDEETNTLVVGSEKTLVVLDLVTKQVKRRFQGHAARINAVEISKGGETFLSGSYDATVKIWDGRSRSHEPIQTLSDAKDSITALSIDQEGGNAIVYTASVDGKIRSYDLRKGILKTDDFQSVVTGMALTKDRQNLVANCLDGVIRLSDVSSGELQNTYKGEHRAGQYALECSVDASDSIILTGSEDGALVLYDLVRASTLRRLKGHTRPCCSVASHPLVDFKDVCLSAGYDGTAIVWAASHDFIGW